MKVARVVDAAQPPTLIADDIPRPQPGPGELLVHVRAAGVTTTELSWSPTSHNKSGGIRTHAVPGHEFSGVVAAVGDGLSSDEIGREVFGMNDWYSDGAMAEYCTAPLSAIVPKPRRLTHAEAASVPIGALTAWQGLFDRAKLQPGESVLVHGGAGAVGLFAVQLARRHGAHVIATASGRNRDFVLGLGAHQVIDYRAERFENCVKELDVVFDAVGGETLERSWKVLKPGGRMVTIVSEVDDSTEPRIKQAFFIVEPNQNQLAEIAGLLDGGELRTFVDSVFPLSQAADVFAGKAARQGRGKLVIEIGNGLSG
jgi:NADPH:quinone reductase-like Zn-dependent oxidoreductase